MEEIAECLGFVLLEDWRLGWEVPSGGTGGVRERRSNLMSTMGFFGWWFRTTRNNASGTREVPEIKKPFFNLP